MKKANDILKDLGFKSESATSTQEAFVSRLIKVARDGSQNSAQEIRIRDFEAVIPSRHSRPTPNAVKATESSPKPMLAELAIQVVKKSRRSKSVVSENQLAFNFDESIVEKRK